MAKGQQLLAEMFGYVESLGGDGVKRGQLVPFDHPSSPLTLNEIEDIASGCAGGAEAGTVILQRQEIRKLKNKAAVDRVPSSPRRSSHFVLCCTKCGVPMRADRKLQKHEARCQGLVQG